MKTLLALLFVLAGSPAYPHSGDTGIEGVIKEVPTRKAAPPAAEEEESEEKKNRHANVFWLPKDENAHKNGSTPENQLHRSLVGLAKAGFTQIVVKVGASWCGPCGQINQLVQSKWAEEHGKTAFVYVDADHNHASLRALRGMKFPNSNESLLAAGSIPVGIFFDASGEDYFARPPSIIGAAGWETRLK